MDRHTFTTTLLYNMIDYMTTEFTDNPTAINTYQHVTIESKLKAMDAIENQFNSQMKIALETELRSIFKKIGGRRNRL